MTRYFKATRPDGRDFYTGTVDYAAALVSGELVTHTDPADAAGAAGYLSVSVSAADCTGMDWPCRLFEVEPVDPWTPEPASLPSKRACHSLRVVRELPAHEALGPQGVHVAALIDRARSLTDAEARRLDAALDAAGRNTARSTAWEAAWDTAVDAVWDAALDAGRRAAWNAAWNAARYAARDTARDAARDAAWGAVWGAAWDAAWNAARGTARYAARDAARDAAWGAVWDTVQDTAPDAARALVVRDLIDADHYDTLTMLWRTAIGPIHPDDPDITTKETK